ncbi:MAG: chitobiase/beta-hexosaminidase C-terminal domain-containing protein [Flavisolibacter sp.]
MLLFLLLFENRIVLPAWLQVAGRMHPMILHFPIVLVVLYVIWILFFQKSISPEETAIHIGEWLLLLSAFTSAVTALMGLFLSREEGYDADALLWHKWGGIAVSLIMLLWYAYRNSLQRTKTGTIAVTLLSFVFIIFTGHQGAGITHGQNFLIAPILPEQKQREVLLEDAVVFTDMVKPILQSKCMNCHNSKKAKGDLVMETQDLLLKGGKTGKLWDSTEADFGLLMKRIHLPVEAKKHMPPQGKPQLTDEEITILSNWIKTGADFKSKVVELDANSELRKIAERNFTTIETEEYEFEEADNKKVQQLNNNYRIVYPLAKNSPALSAEFFTASQFNAQGLKDLIEIKKQLVSLNLDKMPVKDEDLKIIGQFTELRNLNLSFTGITGATLDELKGLKELKHLSLSGTPIKPGAIKNLSFLKQLTRLYIWNCGVTDDAIKDLQSDNKELVIDKGFRGDTIILKLTPPVLENEKQVIINSEKLRLKHYIKGVTIRYTLDGTRPDSLKSNVYNNDVTISNNAHLVAKAFKPGWNSSDSMEAFFYKASYMADSLVYLLPTDKAYKDEKGRILIDGVKGDNNYGSGKWVGFTLNRMEALLVYNQNAEVSRVSVSSLIDIAGYLMPPQSIEVWGGKDRMHMKLLDRMTPEQPHKQKPAYQKVYELHFKPARVRYLKIIAIPVSKLPSWHPGKGKPGWFFSDEIFVN